MANENISKNTQERLVDNGRDTKNPGPYLARVIEHLDSTYTGGLKVELLKTAEAGNIGETLGQIVEAHYASPFYGLTNAQKGPGPNDTYDDTQKSYGFWMVPPDPGALVLVTFVEGSRDFAYWFACVPERGMTFNLPSTDASTEMTSGNVPPELRGKRLPTGEYNKKIQRPNSNNVVKYKRPVHDEYINVLIEQGLVEDDIRGICSTSAQRETPSAVFGFSSPGPLDKRGGKPTAPVGIKENKAEIPVSRLGSSSIFIDDGDDKLIRKGKPTDTPYEYVNKEAGEGGGDVTVPHNEMIRLKTRTGAQILMHTSEDLIYIANSRGTAWIEFTSNGKIDMWADDSISIHTEQDLNIVADRDINLEAGRNIHMNAVENIYQTCGTNWETRVGNDAMWNALNTTNIRSRHHKETADRIDENSSNFPATGAIAALFPKRVPQHEPWNGHENWNPPEVTPDKTEAVETSQDVHFDDRKGPGDRTPIDGADKPEVY